MNWELVGIVAAVAVVSYLSVNLLFGLMLYAVGCELASRGADTGKGDS
jgi:hypothetical protein